MCRRRIIREPDSPAKQTRVANSQLWCLVCPDAGEKVQNAYSWSVLPFYQSDCMKELVRLLREPGDDLANLYEMIDAITVNPVSTTQGRSPFQMLPPELHGMITDELDNFDLISLSLTSTYFFNVAKTRLKRMVAKRTVGAWTGRGVTVEGHDNAMLNNPPAHEYRNTYGGHSRHGTFGGRKMNWNSEQREEIEKINSKYLASIDYVNNHVFAAHGPETVPEKDAEIKEREKKIEAMIKKKKEYPEAVIGMLKALLQGEPVKMVKPRGKKRRRAVQAYDPAVKDYVIRNLSKRQYISYAKSSNTVGEVIKTAEGINWSRQGVLTCGPETGAILSFIISIMQGAPPLTSHDVHLRKRVSEGFYRGLWAGDTFDIVENDEEDLEGWEDVSDRIYGDVGDKIRTFWKITEQPARPDAPNLLPPAVINDLRTGLKAPVQAPDMHASFVPIN